MPAAPGLGRVAVHHGKRLADFHRIANLDEPLVQGAGAGGFDRIDGLVRLQFAEGLVGGDDVAHRRRAGSRARAGRRGAGRGKAGDCNEDREGGENTPGLNRRGGQPVRQVNKDPDRLPSTSLLYPQLLTSGQVTLGFEGGSDLFRYTTLIIQHMSGQASQPNQTFEFGRYNITGND